MKKWLFLILTITLFTSCIGIESIISIKSDGSGRLSLSYKVSRTHKFMESDKDSSVLLPITKEEFERTANETDGLSLLSIDQKEDAENIFIKTLLEFNRVESLNAIGRENHMDLSLTEKGDTTVFKQVIYPGLGEEEITQDSLDMIETFFDGYDLVFIVQTPGSVKSHSLGELSQDKKSITYRVSIPELIVKKEAVILEVTW